MNKNILLYIAIVINTVGCTLIGLAFGKLFNEIWAGILMGFGIGMIITTIILLKTHQKASPENEVFDTDKKNTNITLPKKNEG